jgi:DNA gyrase inhibitor GyrI
MQVTELFVKIDNENFDAVYLMQQTTCVNVILESKSEISPFLPGKFPHCVAANKPILLLAPYYSETRRLLGEEYPYVSEVDNVVEIAALLEKLYRQWKQDNTKLQLNRPDLEGYLSKEYLKEIISSIN